MNQVQALAAAFAPIVRDYVGKALGGVMERLAAIEARPAPERGEKGDAGQQEIGRAHV